MRPVVYIYSIDGQDLTDTLMDRIVRVSVTDTEGFTSDILEVDLDDRGQYVAIPKVGDKLRVAMGYLERERGPIPTLGDFVVDEVRLSGPPLSISFTAKGVDLVNTALKAPKVGHEDAETLDELARRIAQRHNLTPNIHEDAQTILVRHVDQQTESDMALLDRLARSRDWVLRIDAQRLTLRPHAATLAPAVSPDEAMMPPIVQIKAQQIVRYDYTSNARSRYGKVRSWYYDPDKGRRVPVEVEDGEHTDAPTLDLRHDARSEDEALDEAEGRLRQLRRASGSLTLEMPGDTRLLAGYHIYITGLSDPIYGQWVIERAEHTLDAGGLVTRIECVPPNAGGKASEAVIEELLEEVE